VSRQLSVNLHKARALIDRFWGGFPALADYRERCIRELEARGYAAIPGGLRRYRDGSGPLTASERRWAFNTPIQGGAAHAFKLGCNRLRPALESAGGRLVLTLHDAVVLEAPPDRLEDLAGLAAWPAATPCGRRSRSRSRGSR